ncbi:TRAP transporter small permease [Celeribacter naphthalenivorans]|uniref:TRAP transporter small permease n=1 Tax=Celeribacter naphthalenivorans TaxID=1614694 RepID=UPI001CF99F45|nr:TRAP transporter small permease [Celeribacter naphthalenivorans]
MINTNSATRAVDGLFNGLAMIAGLLLVVMMLHVSADVVMKLFFNNPIQGTLEVVSAYYMVIAVFLPLGLVEWTRSSITVDVFYGLFPVWLKVICVVFSLLSMVLIYGMLSYHTWGTAMTSFARKDFLMGGASLEIITWPPRFALPIGFAAASLVSLWHLIAFLIGFERDAWLSESESDADAENHSPE